jgi:hypothetical protein
VDAAAATVVVAAMEVAVGGIDLMLDGRREALPPGTLARSLPGSQANNQGSLPRLPSPHPQGLLMNPKHVNTPIPAGAQRRRCPVCQQAVYSRAGIHPQCAMKQAEPPRPSGKSRAASRRDVAIAVVTPEIDTSETAPKAAS